MEKLKISNDESEVTLQLKDLKQMGSFIITKNQVLFLTTDDFNKMNTHQRIGLSEIMKKLIEADLENHLKKHGYEEQKSEENWWDYYSYEDSGELEYRIPNYKIERFKNKVRELNAELNSYLKQLKELNERTNQLHDSYKFIYKQYNNESGRTENIRLQAVKFCNVLDEIQRQNQLKGYPTAKEWSSLVDLAINTRKEVISLNKEHHTLEAEQKTSDFGSQNEGGNPL